MRQRVGKNMREGALMGIAVATAFSAFVLVAALFAKTPAEERIGAPVGVLIAAYYVSLGGAGLIAGVLAPLGRTWLGAVILGWFCAAAAVAGIMVPLE